MHNLPFAYKVKKNKLSKSIRINISNDGEILVTLPKYIPEKFAHSFVNEKKDWILAQIENQKSNINCNFDHGSKISFLGDLLTIYIIEKPIQNSKAQISTSDLLIKVPLGETKNKRIIRQAIVNEYKKNFRSIVEEGVVEYNKYYQFDFNRIAIKDNKTNWGSCSTKKNLNFNWKLIFAPLNIIDYVIVHELCHLKEHNHSQNFWSLVSEQIPDYKIRRKWLKENSKKLII